MTIRAKKNGFTFIEVLVAITIFSVMAVSIYYSLKTGIDMWSKGNDVIERNQRLRVAFGDMERNLKNAVSFSLKKSETASNPESEWDPDRIVFYAIVSVSETGGIHNELAKLIYSFDKEKKCLIRKCAKKDEGFEEQYAEEEVLSDAVEDFGIEYAYKAADTYEWKNVWPIGGDMPRGIKVKITFKEKDLPEESFEKIIFVPMGKFGETGEPGESAS